MNKVEQVVYSMDNYVQWHRKYTSVTVTKESEMDTILPQLQADFARFPKKGKERHSLEKFYYLYSKWCLYKTVYRFTEESFWNELINTDDSEVYLQILRRLPVTTFLVVPPAGERICYLIHIETQEDEALIYSVEIYASDGKKLYTAPDNMRIENGEKISVALKRFFNMCGKNPDEDEYYEREFESLKMAVQIAYYLAAQNAVIKEVKTPKAARPKRPDGKPMNLRQWDVGYRIGSSYPDRARTGSGTTAPDVHRSTGNSPRPHIRRAHWHHYWAGKGRTELILKWLDPIMVNPTGEIVATEHLAG